MELIIGREAGASRLRISINNQDRFWGNANSVPKSVSRQHCKVVTDDKGGYIITNLKPENVTYVNGVQIESKHISGKDRIELGADRYFMDIAAIIKGLGASIPKSFSIRHLQEVWDEFHDTKLQIQIKEKKSAAIRSVTGVFSMSAIFCGFIPGIADLPALRVILYSAGLLLAIYFFVITYRSSSTLPKFLDDLDKKFHKDYVCPNPECHHFMGYQQYDDLKKMTSCPYCKSKFTEK